MGTNFYLADERVMHPEELEWAHKFDERTLVCHTSLAGTTIDGMIKVKYSLRINVVYLVNLPYDSTLVNDNNDLDIQTIGDLVNALKKENSIVELSSEINVRDAQIYHHWVESNQAFLGKYKSSFNPPSATPIIERYLFNKNIK